MGSYSDRYNALCNIIDDLPEPFGDVENRFQLGVASGSSTRSYKLDHFVSTNKSRKGKEVERYTQVEQLRLSERDFENLGQIGDGQFGSVSAVRCKLDGQVYAMKTIKKFTAIRAGPQMNLPLERYIHTLPTEQGRSLVPEIVAAFQTDSALHLMTTYAAHGSLWDRMCNLGEGVGGSGETSQAGRMAEEEIRWWGSQMVGAIEWLHGQGFVHRDIKPHNFLIHSPSRLTLTDFGSAASLVHSPSYADDPRPYVKKQNCLMPIGTPDYIAPEILKMAEDAMIDGFDTSEIDPDQTIRPGDLEPRGYGVDVDWWSFGATVYEMSAGKAPFYARTVRETYELIMKCGEGAYQPATAGMSADLRSLMLSLLTASNIRLGTDLTRAVSAHPFFAQGRHEDHPPQSVLSLPLIEIGGRSDQTDTEVTFDHHFQSSVGMTTTLTSSCSSNQTTRTIEQTAPDRWCGWTWIPPPHAFAQPSSPTTSNRPMRPLPRQVPPVTPARTSTSIAMPMTTPRSKIRSRPISDKRAMAELVKCVQHSARKRASSVKPRFPSSQLGGAGKEAWTPTPKPRPVLVERASKQNEPAGVEALVARQIRLEDGLTGLEKRFARLKTRLQTS